MGLGFVFECLTKGERRQGGGAACEGREKNGRRRRSRGRWRPEKEEGKARREEGGDERK